MVQAEAPLCPACGRRFERPDEETYECRACKVRVRIGEGDLPPEVRDAGRKPEARFGKFVLVRQVGSGGFGAVYRAWQTDLRRFVALKFLHTQEPEDLARFRREAQIAARLQHPHIVPVFEVGEQDGRSYLSMEFVEGRTLREIRPDPRKSLEAMQTVALAVHYAHEQGIVHRDLKPHNLMLGTDGRVRVMDFGLARPLRGGATLTGSGTVVGTPAYMAPEQAAGLPCDARSDVYSLGATLYELLCGHPPFTGESPLEVLDRARSQDPVSLRKIDPAIHPEVETIVAKALEKDAVRRYKSARALAEDLRRHLAGEPILARPTGPLVRIGKWVRRRRALSAALAVILVGLLVAAGALAANAIRSRREVARVVRDAEAAEREGRFRDARDLYARLKTLDRSHPAAARFHDMDRAAEAQERRREADKYVLMGRHAREEYENLSLEIERLEQKQRDLSKSIPSHEAKKQPLWDVESMLDRKRQERSDGRSVMLSSYARAAAADPDHPEAKPFLREYYWTEFLRAEAAGDQERAAECRLLVALYDTAGRYKDRFDAKGTLELTSIPPGAQAELLRYEEASDRRLVAQSPRILGTCPIPSMVLPAGSYLAVLRKAGFRDVRYPVLIGRDTALSAKVRLYTEDEIGRDFVYVPAGRFIRGDNSSPVGFSEYDPNAVVDDFFIGRFEVTCEEYRAFVESRARANRKEAQDLLPRDPERQGYIWGLEPDGTVGAKYIQGMEKWAIMGISGDNAAAYCTWRTEQARARGEKVLYRLPTLAEWEKAARGVDGRPFPWGRHFDWSFTSGYRSRPTPTLPVDVGTFAKDESPYGVRDMAGSQVEWCRDRWATAPDNQGLAGSSWMHSDWRCFRVSAHDYGNHESAHASHGFRVVRVLEQR
ncbi:MAG: protein kinase [Planctomycetes bacterium]|nr:protein kinase [Planctomycetota bacterium]